MIGEVQVEVKVAENTEPQNIHKFPVMVVDGEGHTLLGRSSVREMRLDCHNLFVVIGEQSIMWEHGKKTRGHIRGAQSGI